MVIKKILRIFKFFNLLFKVSFKFNNPEKADIIIFDYIYSKKIKNIFIKQNIKLHLLEVRYKEIKEIYLSKDLIIFFLKNIFKFSIKINYLISLINIIKPKLIITRIDTSKDFQIIAKIFHKKIKCISLQQGDRTVSYLGGNVNISDSSLKVLKNYFIPEFYVFAEYDKKLFQSFNSNIINYEIAGSLNLSLAKKYIKERKLNFTKKKYDFCLVADPHINSLTGMIFKYLHDFCIKENLKYIIAADTDLSDNFEINYYKSFVSSKKINIFRGNRKTFSSYLTGLRSKVIIGHSSTLLREFVGLKKKVISINGFKMNKIATLDIFTYKKNKGIVKWYPKKNSYYKFSNHLSKIHKMTTSEYYNLFKNSDYFMPNIDTIKFVKEKTNKIL